MMSPSTATAATASHEDECGGGCCDTGVGVVHDGAAAAVAVEAGSSDPSENDASASAATAVAAASASATASEQPQPHVSDTDDTDDSKVLFLLNEALSKARWNELVQISFGSNNNNSSHSCSSSSLTKNSTSSAAVAAATTSTTTQTLTFVPCFEEEFGGVSWNLLQGGCSSDEDCVDVDESLSLQLQQQQQQRRRQLEEKRHVQTKPWIIAMLNDRHRNHLYETAIRAACQRLVQDKLSILFQHHHPPPPAATNNGSSSSNKNNNRKIVIRVLDIGSGTGLLAMMAARSLQACISAAAAAADTDTAAIAVQDCLSFSIVSLEMSSAMANIARTIVSQNGFDNNVIQIVETHSFQYQLEQDHDDTDNDHRFDMCLSELLEDGLLGEGIVPTLRDAWNRQLLKPSAVIIPACARAYVQVVSATTSNNHNNTTASRNGDGGGPDAPGSWMQNLYGPHNNDNDRIRLSMDNNDTTGASAGCGAGALQLDAQAVVWPVHADKLLLRSDNNKTLQLVSEPIELFSFDFSNPMALPSSCGRRKRLSTAIVTQAATVGQQEEEEPAAAAAAVANANANQDIPIHGFLVWWELDLMKNGSKNDCNNHTSTLTYSMKPGSGQAAFQDHWHATLQVLPKEQCRTIRTGFTTTTNSNSNSNYITLEASHNDERIFVRLVTEDDDNDQNDKDRCDGQMMTLPSSSNYDPEEEKEAKRPRFENRDSSFSALISPYRARQLNDTTRRDAFRIALQRALDKHGRDALLVDISDFSLGAILAAVELRARNVISVESSSSNSSSTAGAGSSMAMIAARVAQIANRLPRPDCHFEILQCRTEQLTHAVLDNQTIHVLVAEPYYAVLEGFHLQEALCFYYTVRSLRKRGLVSPHATIVPAACRIMGCVIESEQIRHAYQSCGGHDDDHHYKNEDSLDSSVSSSSNKATRHLIHGFDHQYLHQLRGDDFELVLDMDNFVYTKLTNDFEIARLDYQDMDTSQSVGGSIVRAELGGGIPFIKAGVCDALVVWIDYSMSPCDNTTSHSESFPESVSAGVRKLVKLFDDEPVTRIRETDLGHTTDGAAELFVKLILGGNIANGSKSHMLQVKLLHPTKQCKGLSVGA